jgi:glutamine amidotransferase
MCRLFGVRADHPVDLRRALTTGPRPFHRLGEKHPHGWGIGWYDHGRAHVRHEAHSAAHSPEFPAAAAQVRSSLVVAHVRKATCGEVSAANCHPFRHHNWLFAHNGSIERESLYARLDPEHRDAIRGQTDSEVFFHWLLQNIEQTGSVPQGLRQAVAVVTSFTSLNFVLTDGAVLYAYRDATQQEEYYSLFSLRHTSGGGPPVTGAAVLVCSEQLTDDAWNEIPMGRLLTIAADLTSELVAVR